MNRNSSVNYLLAVGGGYLIYLGIKLIKTFFDGEASLGFFSIVLGGLFIALGLGVLGREWYHYTHPKKDDDDESELFENDEALENPDMLDNPREESDEQ